MLQAYFETIGTSGRCIAIVFSNVWFHRGGQTPSLSAQARFMPIDLPAAAVVRDVPVLGPLYDGLIAPKAAGVPYVKER
jgi:hypothetical protein